jgi:DNA repair photolyase
VAVYIAPVIPLLNEHELEAILEACAARGATQALYTILRLPREVRDLFAEWLQRWYPEKAAEIWHLIQAMHEGRDYDPSFVKRMVGTGARAQALRQRFDAAAARLGLTFPGRTLNTSLFGSTQSGPQGSLF